MPGVKVQANRTTGSGPPPELLFGEIAYSDADQQLYVGRANSELPPTAFSGSSTDYSAAIAALEDGLTAQDSVINGLAADIALLDSSQTTQDLSIAAIEAEQVSQNTAIAAFSTIAGALAPVATSGAYSDLTGKPSLFSGAYADLTGKPSLFSGAYADLTGKPSLFSGAYADLSGKPTLAAVATSGSYTDLTSKPALAFTYDQQTEPASPSAGATWRERSAGGLIIGEWEWSGSLWLGALRYAANYSGVSATATPTPVMIGIPKFPALLVGYSVNTGPPIAPQDASNYWNFRHSSIGQSDWLSTIGVDQVNASCLTKTLSTPIILTGPESNDNRPTKVGSAGNLRAYQAITHYRLIR